MKPRLAVIVFLSGAAVMVLELVGSRVVAPYLGSSTFVWTSLIGTVLGALSIGYYVGGRYADRGPSYQKLGSILFGAALCVLGTSVTKDLVALLIGSTIHDLRIASIVAAMTLFGPCSVLLGMVSPYCIRLAMNDVAHSGSTVGTLYALSTAGSILGTFLGGFWLISFLGTTHILFTLTILLSLLSLIAAPKRTAVPAAVLISLVAVLIARHTPHPWKMTTDLDTPYQRIWVIDDSSNERPVRLLASGPEGVQSGMYRDTGEPIEGYLAEFATAVASIPRKTNILVIGGAGMILPRILAEKYPESQVHTIELDPGMTEIARDYFNLEDRPNLTIEHIDGRLFFNTSQKQFDIVILDAFAGGITIPFHLVTVEALQGVRRILNPHGVVLQNVVGTFTGEGSRATRAIVGTYRAAFPFVQVSAVTPERASTTPQNIAVIGSLEPVDTPNGLSHQRSFHEEELLPPLTDDFSPLEAYMLGVTRAQRL